jgi:hypothetical protein
LQEYGVKRVPFALEKAFEGTDAVFLPVDYGYYEKVSLS